MGASPSYITGRFQLCMEMVYKHWRMGYIPLLQAALDTLRDVLRQANDDFVFSTSSIRLMEATL